MQIVMLTNRHPKINSINKRLILQQSNIELMSILNWGKLL